MFNLKHNERVMLFGKLSINSDILMLPITLIISIGLRGQGGLRSEESIGSMLMQNLICCIALFEFSKHIQ